MKDLVKKINAFSDRFNSFELSAESQEAFDELRNLKVLFTELQKNAESICIKSSDSVENFESLINLLSEVVFELDQNGIFTFMNSYGIKKLNIDRPDLEQGLINISDVIHADDLELAKASLLGNLSGNRTNGNEYRLMAGDENIIVQIFNSSILKNDKVIGLRGIAIDVTHHRMMEEELRKSVEKYKGIFDNSPLAIGYYNPNGILTDCNVKFATMLGSSRETLKGFNIFKDLQNQGLLDALRESLISGSGAYEGIYKAVLTGRQAPSRILFQGIRNEQGKIYSGVVLAEDISERMEAEKALRASEEKFRKLVENIGEGAGITDMENTFVFSNPAANSFFGVEKEGLINRSLKDFMSPTEFDRIEKETNKRKKGLNSSYELEIIRPDGQTRDLLVTATPNYNEDGEYKSTLGIFRDITERKIIERELKEAHESLLLKNRELNLAKEKAEESDKLKSAFLSTMNHELRTPLNHIIGLSGLVDRTMPLTDIEDFGMEINRSGNNLLSLIDDIFQTIELEMGDVIPEIAPINVDEFLLEVLSDAIIHKENLKKNHLEISLASQAEISQLNFMGDRVLLKKVFDNLIHNAIKFTNEGEIQFGLENWDSHQLTFYVKDTGIGIPTEKHHQIFERFRQIDQRLKREYGGTGLGLYYSKKIIELLKGKIWFESENGKGTRFLFSIAHIV